MNNSKKPQNKNKKQKKRNKAKSKKPKRRKKTKKHKSEAPERLKDIQIPVDLEIPKCEVCKKKQAHLYCKSCNTHYCQNCETEVHTPFSKKKHKEFIFQEPYVEKRQIASPSKCTIHQRKKLSRYCKHCQKLICRKCYSDHSNHETISFDQPNNFYKELINEQKNCTQNHFESINENFEQLNYSEKKMKAKKEKILKEISDFYLVQKMLLDSLEQNEKKLVNDFYEQISDDMQNEKQRINDSKSSTQKLLKKFHKLETKFNYSNLFEFFKLFSRMQLTKNQQNQNLKFPRLCKEHKNKPFQYFCLDHKQLLCVDCAILNHTNCQKSNNFKEVYGKIQNKLKKLILKIKVTNNSKKEFLQKIKNEQLNCLKEKQKHLEIVKRNYQKLNEQTQKQFKNMNEEISIEQNEKYVKLNNQSNEIQKEIENFEKSEIIIKEIEIYKKNNDYREILINYSKLKQILSINQENEKNQLICNSKFKERNNKKLIGEYLFEKEGEYEINNQNIPKSPKSYYEVIDFDDIKFLKESEILQKEKNPKFNQILEYWIKKAGCKKNLQRRYNSRTDGWKIKTFHEKCDNKGKSIVLIKLKNNSLFGGFAAIDWDSTNKWKQSTGNKSFLFSLISLDPNFKKTLKMRVKKNKGYEIYCGSRYGPTFGGGCDLGLGFGENMNHKMYTKSNLGDTYKPPFGYEYTYGSNQTQNFLAGSYHNWDFSQIEIFCEN
ncbi:hypothetical protein M0812_27136 [Anaeramoeba flamelloides]|uniref:B box-type domain-containing protein n=1 Tax=Anaeramoeba flamelloides TaxID=1746091 RepID=A0AAV7YEG9_9EUKA|nr:hypothetical protein M0812_27136 [Anaeramoeba flamelloides]